ncbi:uncharacterized protein LOC107878050 [Capsicum annuum]|uniref:uncharacterized protein LOC107878050 n=1 Tax=Capsicum annuum TaxID=4072 RepID=UPI0007BF34A5|nr:uncharacterized protein LOC107878050 [Capsicum annuum]
MSQLCTTFNQRKSRMLPSDTVQKRWNDGLCMAITTRSGKILLGPTVGKPAVDEVAVDEPEGGPIEFEKLDNSDNVLEKGEEKEKKALEQMLGYAKFMKDLMTKKRVVSYELEGNLYYCSAISTRTLVKKKPGPGAFTIPCTIGTMDFSKALCDLGASINLRSLAFYRNLGLGNAIPTNMRLVMVDRSVKRLVGILYDVLVKLSNFIFLEDFIILDCKVDVKVPIILG